MERLSPDLAPPRCRNGRDGRELDFRDRVICLVLRSSYTTTALACGQLVGGLGAEILTTATFARPHLCQRRPDLGPVDGTVWPPGTVCAATRTARRRSPAVRTAGRSARRRWSPPPPPHRGPHPPRYPVRDASSGVLMPSSTRNDTNQCRRHGHGRRADHLHRPAARQPEPHPAQLGQLHPRMARG